MQVKCPTCQTDIEWGEQSPHRPFCCKRCQLIDLGEWANEEKAIPAAGNINEEVQLRTDIDIEEIEAMLSKQEQDFFKS